MQKRNNKYLIAVSGGSDSMFLLDRYKNENCVVAHVNYHQRDDSDIETDIVANFCKRYKIPLFVLHLAKEDYKQGNFEDWAREKRYEFFRKVYFENDCDTLLIAHNKDDFFESALMAWESNKKKDFFGIKKRNFIYGMNVYRPYVNKYWKDEIAFKCIKERIPFHIDSSNLHEQYKRNKIRLTYRHHKIRKIAWYLYFMQLNKKLQLETLKVNFLYQKWEKAQFSQDFFEKLSSKDKLVYKFINEHYENINLSKGKIKSIISFIISSNRTSQYKLNENNYLEKKKGKLIINNISK
ncbi:tRNA lysidine(34) synthetase TilS [Mycoplasma seminis]|uniref:tRNA(Ile)-lysidine synthase n=1 Tax=Mycoplasma seminis TaxID=512749 RepID=A0ABY9HCZ2_9MOLU|nr:tRNA lysidine(34) synthetase TilS [Mycoplasma seminis]WLP85548.1 tRNA lysidine(34) synthetase TilS [Mycoplasma seminis]